MKKYEIYQVVENNSTRAENLICERETSSEVVNVLREIARDYDSHVSVTKALVRRLSRIDGFREKLGILPDVRVDLTIFVQNLCVYTPNEGTFYVRIVNND